MKMGKLILIMFLFCFSLFTTSCNKIEKFAPEENYYIEFVDNYKTEDTERLIKGIKSGLLKENFIFRAPDNNPNNFYSTLGKEEQIETAKLDKFHQKIHVFKDIKDYNADDKKVFKIKVEVNNLETDHGFRLNIKIFNKQGHKDWQPYSNPGDFEYKGREFRSEFEFYQRAIDNIVMLTFK